MTPQTSLPGSSVHGIFQARILEWAATPSPGDLPYPGIKPMSLASPALAGRFFFTTKSPKIGFIVYCWFLLFIAKIYAQRGYREELKTSNYIYISVWRYYWIQYSDIGIATTNITETHASPSCGLAVGHMDLSASAPVLLSRVQQCWWLLFSLTLQLFFWPHCNREGWFKFPVVSHFLTKLSSKRWQDIYSHIEIGSEPKRQSLWSCHHRGIT